MIGAIKARPILAFNPNEPTVNKTEQLSRDGFRSETITALIVDWFGYGHRDQTTEGQLGMWVENSPLLQIATSGVVVYPQGYASCETFFFRERNHVGKLVSTTAIATQGAEIHNMKNNDETDYKDPTKMSTLLKLFYNFTILNIRTENCDYIS